MKKNIKKIVIFGVGNIAEVAHFYFKNDSAYEVVAFTVDNQYIKETHFCDLPVIAFEQLTKEFPSDDHGFFAALSYVNLNQARAEKYQLAKAKGYQVVSYISSKATIWPDLSQAENCFILEDNTIQPFVKIGNNVTLWSGNHIGHHSDIQDNCFISSHVVVSGGVVVKNNCFIGVNATLRDHITIGENCIIAAGSLVVKDTQPNGVYVGQPAQWVKNSLEQTRI